MNIISEDMYGNKILLIPEWMLTYCREIHHLLVPMKRTSGYVDRVCSERGQGDLMDLIGSQMMFYLFSSFNKVVSLDLTCGMGDTHDISIRIGEANTNWNVKTSKFGPYRSNLNLIIKQEEINKKLDGYIQLLIHLDEGGEAPHIHPIGYIRTFSERWEKYKNNIVQLPVNGHEGIMIPMKELDKISKLVGMANAKF